MEDISYKLYIHKNKINSKVYVGITSQINPNTRWCNGLGYKNQSKFYNAIKKYGWDNFEHIILFEDLSLDEANKLEMEYIKKYNALDPNYGYNYKEGGTNGRHTEATKKKISENNARWNKGKHHTPEQIEKLKLVWVRRKEDGDFVSWNKGRKLSEETKNKIRQANLGKQLSEETKIKISKALKGKNKRPFSKEHRKHIGDATKGRKWNDVQREKIKSQLSNRIWVNFNNKTQKWIKRDMLEEYLNSGWKLGMVKKEMS